MRVRDSFLLVAATSTRSPLTTVQLGLQLLERTVDPDAGSQVNNGLRPCRRFLRLAEDLVDVARHGEGKLHIKREPTDVAAAVRDVVHQFEELTSNSGCKISVDAPEMLTAEVDPIRFEQMLENLLSNAIKYGRDFSIQVRLRAGTDQMRLEVVDEGVGIPPADRERIFERFERAVSERAYGGLGLGLFLVKQIVQAHGGSVCVEDAPKRGSNFIVDLPLRPARPDNPAA